MARVLEGGSQKMKFGGMSLSAVSSKGKSKNKSKMKTSAFGDRGASTSSTDDSSLIRGFRNGSVVSTYNKKKAAPLVLSIGNGWRLPPEELDSKNATTRTPATTDSNGNSKVVDRMEIVNEDVSKSDKKASKSPSKSRANTDNTTTVTEPSDDVSTTDADTTMDDLPPLLRNRPRQLLEIEDETEKFRFDVSCRPDAANEDDYKRVPIHLFGEAYLRGIGWEPGKPIGLHSNEIVPVISYVARQQRLGLGAKPKPIPEPKDKKGKKKIIRPGESREPKPEYALPTRDDGSGRVRHWKKAGEKLEKIKDPLGVGGKISIIGGTHNGLTGTVIKKLASHAEIRLPSEEIVAVSLSHLIPYSEKDSRNRDRKRRRDNGISNYEVDYDDRDRKNKRKYKYDKDKYNHKGQGYNSDAGSDDDNSSYYKKESKKSRDKKHKHKSKSDKHKDHRSKIWAVPGIRVKILDKQLCHGKYYARVAWVEDVLHRGKCVVKLESSGKGRDSTLHEIDQTNLETVVPQVGGKVIVLKGEYKTQLGKVIERDSGKNRVHVQLDEDLEIQSFTFDDIAQVAQDTVVMF